MKYDYNRDSTIKSIEREEKERNGYNNIKSETARKHQIMGLDLKKN